jgi:hypothetical protein
MNIQLNFDTDNDSLDDLKKVCAILQEVINRREKKIPLNEVDLCNVKYNEPKQEVQSKEQSSKPQQSSKPKTSGGCRVIPYEDMSDMMAKIYGKKRN